MNSFLGFLGQFFQICLLFSFRHFFTSVTMFYVEGCQYTLQTKYSTIVLLTKSMEHCALFGTWFWILFHKYLLISKCDKVFSLDHINIPENHFDAPAKYHHAPQTQYPCCYLSASWKYAEFYHSHEPPDPCL